MTLERQASAAGGKVHALLGNHEIMNMIAETRDVSPEVFSSFGGETASAPRSAGRQVRQVAADQANPRERRRNGVHARGDQSGLLEREPRRTEPPGAAGGSGMGRGPSLARRAEPRQTISADPGNRSCRSHRGRSRQRHHDGEEAPRTRSTAWCATRAAGGEYRRLEPAQRRRPAVVSGFCNLERRRGGRKDVGRPEASPRKPVRDGPQRSAGRPHHRTIRRFAVSDRYRNAEWKVFSPPAGRRRSKSPAPSPDRFTSPKLARAKAVSPKLARAKAGKLPDGGGRSRRSDHHQTAARLTRQ